MRNHVVRPRGAIRSDRDYILFEKNSFLHNIAWCLRAWAPRLAVMGNIVLIQQIADACDTRDLGRLRSLTDEARRQAWVSLQANDADATAGLLMLLDALTSGLIAESKSPDEFELQQRKP